MKKLKANSDILDALADNAHMPDVENDKAKRLAESAKRLADAKAYLDQRGINILANSGTYRSGSDLKATFARITATQKKAKQKPKAVTTAVICPLKQRN